MKKRKRKKKGQKKNKRKKEKKKKTEKKENKEKKKHENAMREPLTPIRNCGVYGITDARNIGLNIPDVLQAKSDVKKARKRF